MVYFSENYDFWGQTSSFHFISHVLPSISLINFGGILFSIRKQFFKPDYLNQVKAGEGGVQGRQNSGGGGGVAEVNF